MGHGRNIDTKTIDTARSFLVSVTDTGSVPVRIAVNGLGEDGYREALVEVRPTSVSTFPISPGNYKISLMCGHRRGACEAEASIRYF